MATLLTRLEISLSNRCIIIGPIMSRGVTLLTIKKVEYNDYRKNLSRFAVSKTFHLPVLQKLFVPTLSPSFLLNP